MFVSSNGSSFARAMNCRPTISSQSTTYYDYNIEHLPGTYHMIRNSRLLLVENTVENTFFVEKKVVTDRSGTTENQRVKKYLSGNLFEGVGIADQIHRVSLFGFPERKVERVLKALG